MVLDDLQQRSLQHLRSPNKWANWPIQSVKKGHFPTADLGVVIEEHRACVYHINMWSIKGNLDDVLNDVPITEYSDLESMINDGWVVD